MKNNIEKKELEFQYKNNNLNNREMAILKNEEQISNEKK